VDGISVNFARFIYLLEFQAIGLARTIFKDQIETVRSDPTWEEEVHVYHTGPGISTCKCHSRAGEVWPTKY
jgi:hypothetical protein